ncbi:hypothetical protein A9Q99_15425 [Gammaproteobacteria bacterium 45_16_T64]|nr:hypothetical protein A9Q99_15425 [Gammaproteobacteria bacterium 45_16_T64]
MTFTRSYWHDLCGDILGKELHHSPSLHNEKSISNDHEDYANTLNLYKAEFGYSPPNEYWGRLTGNNRSLAKVVALTLSSSLLLTACTQINGDDIEFYVKCAIGVYVIYKVFKWLGPGKGGGGCSSSSCSSCGGD